MIRERCENSQTHIIDLSSFGVSERPHMLLFNEEQTHAILANVAHLPAGEPELYFIDAATRLLAGALEIDTSVSTAQTGGPAAEVICPVVTDDSRFVYATFNGGGLVVFEIDESGSPTLTPRDVYTAAEVAPIGCGGPGRLQDARQHGHG